MEQGKVDEDDPLADLGLEELKHQNKQLRQAIITQTYFFEDEKAKLEAAFKADTSKDKQIKELKEENKDLESRLEEMNFLLDEADKYEQEKQAIHEYERAVEEMIEEIAKKDEEIEEYQTKYTEVEEEQRLMEDLNN